MHFASEERLMEQTEFAGLAEHRAEHHRLLAQGLQLAHRLQYGEGVDLSSLLSFLRTSYTEHIADLDQQYGPWLNERSIH
jgi:hemerythrin